MNTEVITALESISRVMRFNDYTKLTNEQIKEFGIHLEALATVLREEAKQKQSSSKKFDSWEAIVKHIILIENTQNQNGNK
jgi:hypothetical protein